MSPSLQGLILTVSCVCLGYAAGHVPGSLQVAELQQKLTDSETRTRQSRNAAAESKEKLVRCHAQLATCNRNGEQAVQMLSHMSHAQKALKACCEAKRH
ncbi:MAG: hypothetical protein EOP64_00320 [Sphingomonas sp.]|nr:MAG: hypothetical protein EOP64_00320 [Sphingomonas sp.]